MVKKKIAFIFSGQARTSPFSIIPKDRSNIIKKSLLTIFNSNLSKKYNYKIYINVDIIDVDSVINFFGIDKIGNIHVTDSDFYLNPIVNRSVPLEKYLENYEVPTPFLSYPHNINQYWRLYDSYNLYLNDNFFKDAHYIVRLRHDLNIQFTKSSFLDLLTNIKPNELFYDGDIIAIGNNKVMDTYCNAINLKFGKFDVSKDLSLRNEKYSLIFNEEYFKNLDIYRWTFAAEVQLFTILFRWYCEKGINIFTHFHNLKKFGVKLGLIRIKITNSNRILTYKKIFKKIGYLFVILYIYITYEKKNSDSFIWIF